MKMVVLENLGYVPNKNMRFCDLKKKCMLGKKLWYIAGQQEDSLELGPFPGRPYEEGYIAPPGRIRRAGGVLNRPEGPSWEGTVTA
jgi:hypothetical protein